MCAKETTPQVPLIPRIETAYKQLEKSAASLNYASDEFGKLINVLDSSLHRLNLGVSAWVKITGDEDPQTGHWWSRDVGYARERHKWGISLREQKGNYHYPDQDESEQWFFNDGPRWLRVEAVAKVPDLLEALIKQTEETTKKIQAKALQLQDIARALTMMAQAARSKKEESREK
jgi:hypothetical protein